MWLCPMTTSGTSRSSAIRSAACACFGPGMRKRRGTMRRFRERFVHIEKRLAERGRSPSQSDLEEMDALWEEAKQLARAPATTPETK